MNLQSNRIYELNRTGSRIWELIEADVGRMELEETVLNEFDVDRSVASQEIDRLIARFSSEGLIVDREAAA